MSKPLCATFMTLLLMLPAGAAMAQAGPTSGATSPAIGGYSPVSYFEHGEAQLGSAEHAVTHEGEIYYFTDAEQRQRFLTDPERYAPLFPHHCPYNLALGRAAAIDPTNFKIVAGRLLIFHLSAEMNARDEWHKYDSEEQQKLLQRARGNFKLLEF